MKPRDLKMASDGSGEQIFFLYDHSYLQSEEDDIKDAIKYFHPTSVLEDVQWALCGQLMGVVEFLMRFKASDSPSKVFCLRYNKFAVRSVGKYSMVLGGHFSDPDSILQEQLDFMHRLFQFYHSSLIDVLQAPNSGSQTVLLQSICDSFLALIRYYGDSLSTAFNAVPWLHLQKGPVDVLLHASYLLQCCQKTEGVLSGCLFFKNKLLFSQLHMSLVLPLLIIRTHQNNLPCQTINSESELHQGVRLVKVYLSDNQLKLLTSANSPQKFLSSSVKSSDTVKIQTEVVFESWSTEQSTEKKDQYEETDTSEDRDLKDTEDTEVLTTDDLTSKDLSSVERTDSDSKDELPVSDSAKTTSADEVSETHSGYNISKGTEINSVETGEDVAADPVDALTLSQLCVTRKEDCEAAVNIAVLTDENSKVKKKKTILKSKPKTGKTLPKTLDIFKAVKLKLKDSKPEDKLNSLMRNANHSSSEELFAPRPLSLIDLNSDESPAIASSASPKLKKGDFSFISHKRTGFSLNKSQDDGKTKNKGPNNNIAFSPKSASMSEITGKTLNIAERLKMSGSSKFSSSLSTVNTKCDAVESSGSCKIQAHENSLLSDSDRPGSLQKAPKSHNQKRNVSFQEISEEETKSNADCSGKSTAGPDCGVKERDTELHELDLYIQSHSDILLLLFMEKGASQNSKNLKELFRSALPQLGNLDALVKQCSEITEVSRDHNYFHLTFNKVEKQLSGNMLWPITAPQSEFSDAAMNMHDEFKSKPDIQDITWRTYSYCTYGHQGPLRETFYQNQTPFQPTFSPLVERDARLCLDSRAQRQLNDDHSITFL